MRPNLKNLTGVGFRSPFLDDLIDGHSDIGWLEVITENYLWDQGSRRQNLEKLRSHYDIALHGVSLSIAAPEDHDLKYLQDLKKFCDEIRPVRVSDHLCWSSLKSHHWHDLLPFPYTEDNLQRLTMKVSRWQDILQRPLVLENLSTYLACHGSTMSEYAFLNELCNQTGCQMLLDLNNMVVNSINFKIDPLKELDQLNLKHVAQIHLAGFTQNEHFAIDTHSKAPAKETWELLKRVCRERADIPFMMEWDADIPKFSEVWTVLEEARGIYQGAR